jgi:hypothetical protein
MDEDFSNSVLGAIRFTEGLKLVIDEDFSNSVLGGIRYTEGLRMSSGFHGRGLHQFCPYLEPSGIQ